VQGRCGWYEQRRWSNRKPYVNAPPPCPRSWPGLLSVRSSLVSGRLYPQDLPVVAGKKYGARKKTFVESRLVEPDRCSPVTVMTLLSPPPVYPLHLPLPLPHFPDACHARRSSIDVLPLVEADRALLGTDRDVGDGRPWVERPEHGVREMACLI